MRTLAMVDMSDDRAASGWSRMTHWPLTRERTWETIGSMVLRLGGQGSGVGCVTSEKGMSKSTRPNRSGFVFRTVEHKREPLFSICKN